MRDLDQLGTIRTLQTTTRRMKNLLLAITIAAATGCINHKDLAQATADAAEFCTSQEKVAKIENLTLQMANLQASDTLTVLSRVECELTESKGAVSIYNCDGYAIDVIDHNTHKLPISIVVDNEHLIILDLRGL